MTLRTQTIVACDRGACWVLTRGVRTNQGVHTGNICVKSREFTLTSYEIRTKFVRISYEFT